MQQDPPPELSRLGLARFRSAPATWLDALLEDDDSVKPSPPPHHLPASLTQLLSSAGPSGLGLSPTSVGPGHVGSYIQPDTPDPGFQANSNSSAAPAAAAAGVAAGAFQRMNSSPADFMGAGGIDGFFAPTSYDFDHSSSSGGAKRFKDSDFDSYSSTFPSNQRRGELTTANSLVEMEMEKLLEDSVPCRVRAKRGCATHPRSIAERVRRTRISDRIRKLQELVPNMDKRELITSCPHSVITSDCLDKMLPQFSCASCECQDVTLECQTCVPCFSCFWCKYEPPKQCVVPDTRQTTKQTNTADMLEEAVEYVKTLQRQIQELTEQQKKCKCMPES